MLKEFFKNMKIKRLRKKILHLKQDECSYRHWSKKEEEKEICSCCGKNHKTDERHNYAEIIADDKMLEINFLEEELKEYLTTIKKL